METPKSKGPMTHGALGLRAAIYVRTVFVRFRVPTVVLFLDFPRPSLLSIAVSSGRRYFANDSSFQTDVDEDDMEYIEHSSRLDLLWPTAYINSNDTKAVYVAVELSGTNPPVFRQFPGMALSEVSGTLFACEGGESDDECYDPSLRPWYTLAASAGISGDTYLGAASVTEPYSDASTKDWLVTAARAVYSDSSSTSNPKLWGVVGVDIMLQQVQSSIERVRFLTSGYSMLVTAVNGTVIAAPSRFWDRETETTTSTVCDLGIGICDEMGWEAFIEDAEGGAHHFESTEDGEDHVLVAAPVNGTFGVGGEGEVSFYIISVVPRSEIYEPAESMSDLIQESTIQILVTTGVVAAVTLAAVAIAVCLLSGAITRPIADMAAAADSISRDGAKTDVFGNAAKTWNGKESGSGGTSTLEYLLCSGDDEIKLLGREFGSMISGLGKEGRAARTTELEGTTVYPVNPFTPSNRPDS